MKYHEFTTSWGRLSSRGTRRYSRSFDTESAAVAHARKMNASGAVYVRVDETEVETDAPFTDERGIRRSKIVRPYIKWWW